MVLFDAVLHSKHADEVANAISILVFELFKFSVEAGIKKTTPLERCSASYLSIESLHIFLRAVKILTETKMYFIKNHCYSTM